MDQWYGSYHLGMYGSWVWIGAFWDAAIYRYISFLIIYNCLRGGTNIWINQPVSGKKDTGNGNGEHSMWLLANTWWTWLKHTHTFWPFSHAKKWWHGISMDFHCQNWGTPAHLITAEKQSKQPQSKLHRIDSREQIVGQPIVKYMDCNDWTWPQLHSNAG